MSKIVFVDENDRVIGAGTKQEALRDGIIHRIVRIFLFNSKGELLIQKRAGTLDSYLGRWDHSAAGHVDEGESYADAVIQEMREEIGVSGVSLKEIGKLYTEKEKGKAQVQKRFNMIYTGPHDGDVNFDKDEVSEVKWIAPGALTKWIERKPDDFPPGFIRTFEYLRDTSSIAS